MFNTELIYLLAIVFGSILLSMTLHEAAHAYISNALGDDTARLQGRLTLNPLAHIDPLTTILLPLMLAALGAPPFGAAKPVPFNPNRLRFGDYGAALVAVAGPATNLILAAISGLAVRMLPSSLNGYPIVVLTVFSLVNISFCIFNIIPFPPLDGSRVLYAFAPEFIRRVMEMIENSGAIATVLFIIVFYMFLIRPFSSIVSVLSRFLIGL